MITPNITQKLTPRSKKNRRQCPVSGSSRKCDTPPRSLCLCRIVRYMLAPQPSFTGGTRGSMKKKKKRTVFPLHFRRPQACRVYNLSPQAGRHSATRPSDIRRSTSAFCFHACKKIKNTTCFLQKNLKISSTSRCQLTQKQNKKRKKRFHGQSYGYILRQASASTGVITDKYRRLWLRCIEPLPSGMHAFWHGRDPRH